MKLKLILALALAATFSLLTARAADPLRVFIRAGVKTHGPDQHDHPRFLKEWKEMLNERGAKADGAMDFPTAEQLENTDVLVMFAAEAGTISTEQRAYLDKFLQRGGGMVTIHDAVCGKDAPWFKTIIGGAWEHGHSKWYEGEMSFYYMDTGHPITAGVSNFELDDELYYELHMMPEARVLAATYTPKKPSGRGVPKRNVHPMAGRDRAAVRRRPTSPASSITMCWRYRGARVIAPAPGQEAATISSARRAMASASRSCCTACGRNSKRAGRRIAARQQAIACLARSPTACSTSCRATSSSSTNGASTAPVRVSASMAISTSPARCTTRSRSRSATSR